MPSTDAPARLNGRRLWLYLATGVLIYGFLAWWFPLLPNVRRAPPGDIRAFAPTLFGGLLYGALLLILFVLLLAAFRHAAQHGLGGRPLAVVLLGSLALAVPLLLVYTINATDVFRYVVRGRIASAHAANPYLMPPSAFIGDPFLPLTGEWAGETSPYGPLWEIVAAGLTAVSGDSLPAGVLLFKGVALAAFLLTGALIWQLLPAARRPAYTLLWAWNPSLLLTFVANGHNDALMILWLVLGYWLGRRGRPLLGFWVMALAALVKPVALLALPFCFVAWLRDAQPGRARLGWAAAALGGAAGLAWLAFLPWAGEAGIWRTPAELALRLVREATAGAGFSPAVWLYVALGQRVGIEVIGRVGQLLLAGLLAALLWLGWRGRSERRGAADAFFGYVVTALNFRIWYAVWPFPWLLLDDGLESNSRAAYRLRAGLWFLVTTQLSVVLYGHLRVFLLGGDQFLAHLIGVPFVFGLPWLLALYPRQTRIIQT